MRTINEMLDQENVSIGVGKDWVLISCATDREIPLYETNQIVVIDDANS